MLRTLSPQNREVHEVHKLRPTSYVEDVSKWFLLLPCVDCQLDSHRASQKGQRDLCQKVFPLYPFLAICWKKYSTNITKIIIIIIIIIIKIMLCSLFHGGCISYYVFRLYSLILSDNSDKSKLEMVSASHALGRLSKTRKRLEVELAWFEQNIAALGMRGGWKRMN